MSRVLKFRAWDKKKNRWAREWDRDLEDQEDQGYEKEYSEGSYWLDGDVASDLDLVNGRLRLDHYIWEQYTGLKDKDGKEIYEGDVVRYYSDILLGCAICVVTFHNCRWTLFHRDVPVWAISEGDSKNIEVIGNIHESNKELWGESD